MPAKVKKICLGCGLEKLIRKDCTTCSVACSTKIRQLNAPAPAAKPKLTETNTTTPNTWEINLPSTTIRTLDQLIKAFDVDQSIWEVERFVANKWEVVMKPPAFTEMITVTKPNSSNDKVSSVTNTIPMWQRHEEDIHPLHESLYQVKAFFKRKINIVAAKNEIEELKALAKDWAPQPITIEHRVDETGNLLVINLSDHHFGKLAWGYETGHPNYDAKIATDLFNRAFDTILQRASSFVFDEIWFVVGNDLLNSDDMQGRTTKGTVVSTDIRYTKTMSAVRNTLINCVEQLRHFCKLVKVKMVSGNHDQFSVWHLGSSLECFFHNYEDVQIDNSPRYQKYDEFGKIMIMWTHGDKGKRKDFPLLMATEQPKMFGRTKFREIHTGHLHTDRVDEQHGVKVRTLSSLSPADKWHAENGYLGNLRSSEAFIYNKEQGLVATIVYTDNDDHIDSGSPTPLPPRGKK